MPNNKEDKSIEVKKAVVKYKTAIDKNISESEILWNRYSSMLIFHSILIAAIGLTFQSSVNIPRIIVVFLPVAGLISCYLWYSMTSRGFQWIEYWIRSARKIEKEHLADPIKELNPIQIGNEFRSEIIIGWPKTKGASYILISMVALLYFIFLFYSLNTKLTNKMIYPNQQKVIHW